MHELAFATWNIHGCHGAIDAAAIASTLAPLDADVIALQEVGARAGAYDQAAEIAALLGMRAVFGANLSRAGYEYGNAILTRLPLVGSQNVDLSVRGLEPRGCLVVRVRCGETEALVGSAHFGLLHHERASQARRLCEALAPADPVPPPSSAASRPAGSGPVAFGDLPRVVGGDMNDWFPGRDTRRLRARFADA